MPEPTIAAVLVAWERVSDAGMRRLRKARHPDRCRCVICRGDVATLDAHFAALRDGSGQPYGVDLDPGDEIR